MIENRRYWIPADVMIKSEMSAAFIAGFVFVISLFAYSILPDDQPFASGFFLGLATQCSMMAVSSIGIAYILRKSKREGSV